MSVQYSFFFLKNSRDTLLLKMLKSTVLSQEDP